MPIDNTILAVLYQRFRSKTYYRIDVQAYDRLHFCEWTARISSIFTIRKLNKVIFKHMLN